VQRDLDLLRQLLLEIERRGAASPIDTLRPDARHDSDERVRYHLRLLTDAGLLKEAGQTSAGAACVRLTHDGQEFLEFARSDAHWREAKSTILASTGGVPLTVLRSLLARWAWRSVVRNERRRALVNRRYLDRYVERAESGGWSDVSPEAWLDAYASDPDAYWDEGQARRIHERTEFRRGQRAAAAWEPNLYSEVATELADRTAGGPLPEYLI